MASHASVDEAFVTGEPMPGEKTETTEGDRVIRAYINSLGTLVVGEQNFLQQVTHHVEDARALCRSAAAG